MEKRQSLENEIFELTKKFPAEEKYKLCSQIIRSSRSINTNIAEGHGRFTFKDQLNYCIMARGSLSETYNHLIDALDCKYISHEQLEYFRPKINEVERLFNGYITYLRKNIN